MSDLMRMFEHALAKEEAFESNARFRGCPKICHAENLPSFDSVAHIHEWRKRFGEAPDPIVKAWPCGDHWHYLTRPRSPSGESSGSNRRRL